MASGLYIASSGASDVLAAALRHDDRVGPAVVLAPDWQPLAIGPVTGPRGVDDFENLGHDVPGLAEITADTRGRSLLPRLAATVNARVFLLDPSGGACGMRAQMQAAVTYFGPAEVTVVDLGGDLLARGDEPGLRTPLADALVLAALPGLDVPTRVLVAGAGFDGELTDVQVHDQQFYLGGQLRMPLPHWADATRIGDALDWFPSDANRLLVAAMHGYHGVVEIGENAAVVYLGDHSGHWEEFDTARVVAGNAAAGALVDTRSLAEASDIVRTLLVRSEWDDEIVAPAEPSPAAADVDLDAVVAVLEIARERGVDYLTPRRLAQLVHAKPAAVVGHTRGHLLVPTTVRSPGSLAVALHAEQERLDYVLSHERVDLEEDPRVHRPLIPVAGVRGAAALAALATSRKVRDRVAVISDTNTPASVLVALASDPSSNVRRALARRVPVPPAALRLLQDDADRKVREAVAENVGCPPDVLAALAADPHWSVRYSVPPNPQVDASVERAIVASPDEKLRAMLPHFGSLHASTRAALAADESVEVRHALAQTTTDPAILAALIDDPDAYVRAGAAGNERATTEQLRHLVRDRSVKVRGALTFVPDLPEDILQQLAHDRSANVRWCLASLPTTPRHIRELLQNDPDDDVANQAKPPSQR